MIFFLNLGSSKVCLLYKTTLLLFEGILSALFFLLDFGGNVDVLNLCFSEKLPAAGNLAFIFRGQWHY